MSLFEPTISEKISLLGRKHCKKSKFIKQQKYSQRINLLSKKMSENIDKITKNQVVNISIDQRKFDVNYCINLQKVHNKFGIINNSSTPFKRKLKNFKIIAHDYLPLRENYEISKNEVSNK